VETIPQDLNYSIGLIVGCAVDSQLLRASQERVEMLAHRILDSVNAVVKGYPLYEVSAALMVALIEVANNYIATAGGRNEDMDAIAERGWQCLVLAGLSKFMDDPEHPMTVIATLFGTLGWATKAERFSDEVEQSLYDNSLAREIISLLNDKARNNAHIVNALLSAAQAVSASLWARRKAAEKVFTLGSDMIAGWIGGVEDTAKDREGEE
jgi:hypothetical protein